MGFPDTCWTDLAAATLHGDDNAQIALSNFCERYRQPVIAFIRFRRVPEDRVEDLAHDFLKHIMAGSAISRADRTKGKFRNYLLTSLRNFMAGQAERAGAAIRGGGIVHVPLDGDGPEIEDPSSEETRQHDIEWALNLLFRSIENLRSEWEVCGKGQRFEVLRPFVIPGAEPPGYAEASAQLSLTEEAARTEVRRMRVRFGEILRSEVAATVSSIDDVDEEFAWLGEVLRSQRR